MAKTYEQIARQIQALQLRAAALKHKEAVVVIQRIKVAVAFYGLTASDLGLDGTRGTGLKRAGTVAGKPESAAAKNSSKRAGKRTDKRAGKRPSMIRFRSANGQSWTGMGRKPGWLIAGLASGKTLADFAVDAHSAGH